jgi:hypothetical protein
MSNVKYIDVSYHDVGRSLYCEGGLEGLTKLTKSNRIQRLDSEKKAEIKKMLLEQKTMDIFFNKHNYLLQT